MRKPFVPPPPTHDNAGETRYATTLIKKDTIIIKDTVRIKDTNHPDKK